MKEKYLLMRDRQVMPTPVYWNSIVQTSPKMWEIYGISIIKYWTVFINGRQKAFYLKKEFESIGTFIAKKMHEDEKFFKKLEKGVESRKRQTEKFILKIKKKKYANLPYHELINLAEQIRNIWVEFDIWNVPAWFWGGDEFKQKVEQGLKLPEKDFLFLADPVEKTHVSQFDYEYLVSLEKVRKNEKKLPSEAQKLSDRFGWIPFGYDGPDYWDENYFINKLKNDKKDKNKLAKEIKISEENERKNEAKRNSLIKKHQLNKEQMRLIKIIRSLAVWTDDRKYLDFQLNYYYAEILKELEARLEIPYKNLKYIFTEELKGIEKNKKALLEKSNERMAKGFIIESQGGKVRILSEENMIKMIEAAEKQEKNVKEIKGIVASKGGKDVYFGKAKIVWSPKDNIKIKKGDFLVANMTSPDFLVAMKKAASFITDEGGVTCHAAIVAREMNKPCIIGTKIATKFLKDGDDLEMDMSSGIIKKIN